MAKLSKWYVVWAGHNPGVYDSWSECKEQIEGYKQARYKAFLSKSEALRAYEDGAEAFLRHNYTSSKEAFNSSPPNVVALSVDAACAGNPGVMEYRGVMVDDRREVFRVGPFPKGTNNIGEFLAIVHALALLKKQNLQMPIYSDSVTAISWVRNKRCKTLLVRDKQTTQLLDLVYRAEEWLRQNPHSHIPILKWDTSRWGEIPADFGRK
ncbi:MAG: ribonuclease H family protein [Porphyromonadaceae bacterium]|nr:ribonuclease H family protein [Porphyromonadaceae bacterium]